MIVQKMHSTTGVTASVIALGTRRRQQVWIVPNGHVLTRFALRIGFILMSVWRGGLSLFQMLSTKHIILLAMGSSLQVSPSKTIAFNCWIIPVI